ncbi:hypothetical protein BDP27DRAFT_176335, partial [Rhodocollybia butyracea]
LGITLVRLYCLYLTIRSLVYKLGTLYYRSSAKNHELHELQDIPVIAYFPSFPLSPFLCSLFSLFCAILADSARSLPWTYLGLFSRLYLGPISAIPRTLLPLLLGQPWWCVGGVANSFTEVPPFSRPCSLLRIFFPRF